MAAIRSARLSQDWINCGDPIEITVEIEFIGPPTEVAVVLEIQAPCRFRDGSDAIKVRKNGPSPQTVRLVEAISGPSGVTHFPRLRITAIEKSQQPFRVFRDLEVRC